MTGTNDDQWLKTPDEVLRFLNEADEKVDQFEQEVLIVPTDQGPAILMRHRIDNGSPGNRATHIAHLDRLVNRGYALRQGNKVRISPSGKVALRGPYTGRQ